MEAKPRILIVDDYPVLLVSWRILLESAGYHVTTVESGEEALRLLYEGCEFEAMLLDYRMPGMTGLEVLDRIRGDVHLKSLPVIMLTASVLHGEEGLERGANTFVSKPVDIDRMLEVVKLQVSNRQALPPATLA